MTGNEEKKSRKRKGITAAELQSQLEADPAYVERVKQEEEDQAARAAAAAEEERPILADLKKVGIEVNSIWCMVNSKAKFIPALPYLVKHLGLPYSNTTRAGIARALAVPEAHFAWDFIAQLYVDEPETTDGSTNWAKEGLALALSAAATSAELTRVSALMSEQKHGPSRLYLVNALRRLDGVEVEAMLRRFSEDELFSAEIRAVSVAKAKRSRRR
ncbi:hypothetical protein [Terrihabitans rhizophilus]|uniref:Uncharacterized protein n=1 Tax=Terrihabitans rhizophilus TaxID=3092662 RepID=A0ABU4RQQ2_9HYPH|nr:hypothetical protein [Terrihabitans sp. PJ23]MDX6807157.1 hypothetical protein [Terrihabitans sp. PJ23]